jgi:hypothetical protein
VSDTWYITRKRTAASQEVKNSTPSKKSRKFIRNFFFSFFHFLPSIFPFNRKYLIQTSAGFSIIMAPPLYRFPQSTEDKPQSTFSYDMTNSLYACHNHRPSSVVAM